MKCRHLLFSIIFLGLITFVAVCVKADVELGRSPAASRGNQRIIVLLVEFPDAKHTVSYERIRERLKEVDTFYREASYGQMWITSEVTQKWYQVSTPLNQLDIQEWDYNSNDLHKFETEAIHSCDPDINYRNYDYIAIVAAGGVWPNAYSSVEVTTNDGINLLEVAIVNEQSESGVYAHELGHLLPSNYEPWNGKGLPDLYNYDVAKGKKSAGAYVGPWDLMDTDKPARHFSSYSKIMLGWIGSEVVRPISKQLYLLTIQPLERDLGTRAVKIPLRSGEYYLVEVRRKIGFDTILPDEGVLVYHVDETKTSGHGVLQTIDSKPLTKTLDDASFHLEDMFEDRENNVYLLVALTDGSSFTVAISGTDPTKVDSDGDGLTDVEEIRRGTDRFSADTDSDFWSDRADPWPTNPLMPNLIVILPVLILSVTIIIVWKRTSFLKKMPPATSISPPEKAYPTLLGSTVAET